jgi:hypothetical protein
MIKLSRPDNPQYLVDNESGWAAALTAAVEQFNGYKDIPKAQKESLTKHYRHDNIRLPLFAAAHDKCAYCECKPVVGDSYIQVEHFYPKSLYPEHCFDWHNFLPVCARCNLAKSNFDWFIVYNKNFVAITVGWSIMGQNNRYANNDLNEVKQLGALGVGAESGLYFCLFWLLVHVQCDV